MTSIPSGTTSLMPASGRLGLQAITLLFVACAALCTFTGGLLYSQYRDARASRHAELMNLSSSVLRSAESSITYANMILVGLAERYRHDGETPENLARMLSIARTRVDWQPEIQGVFFYAADGRWVMTTLSAITPQRNNSDRDYFQYHLKNENLAPYIGPPIRSRPTGEWIMTVSIRLEDANGAFAGVALATGILAALGRPGTQSAPTVRRFEAKRVASGSKELFGRDRHDHGRGHSGDWRPRWTNLVWPHITPNTYPLKALKTSSDQVKPRTRAASRTARSSTASGVSA
jgi:hypothetical protein